MNENTPQSRADGIEWAGSAGAAVIAVPLCIGVTIASRWPLVHDAPLIHYIVFLVQKGFVPYRDIIDMNMPGTYFLEILGMSVFGGGAAGWYAWDMMGALGTR